MATHFHALKIRDLRRETDDCVSIAFEIPAELQDEFLFTPGQNITLKTVVNGNEIRRSYSICSSPSEKELRVAVKRVPEGLFSCFANSTLKPGDTIEVLAPTGMFFTHPSPDNKKSYLAFAAGSGITPIISIIKTILETEPASSFTLVYGNRDRSSIIFREQLNALKNRYMSRFNLHHILSREQTESEIHNGRIDEEKLMQLGRIIPYHLMDEVFLCGPEQMITTAKDALIQKGIPEKNIHFELFHPPGSAIKTDAAELDKNLEGQNSEVTVKLDGIYIRFDLPFGSESILDAALQEGADLPYACKGGVCATCKAKLIEGSVVMDNNYALEADEIGAGYILTCQSHPRSGKVVVDFDSK